MKATEPMKVLYAAPARLGTGNGLGYRKAVWQAGQRKVAEWLLAGELWNRSRMASADYIHSRLAGLPGELCHKQ
jgi:hypothetical protein